MAAVASLPPKHDVLEACRGLSHGDHFVLCCAGGLAELHEERLGAEITGEIDRQRALLVHDIDLSRATGLCARRFNPAFYPST